MNDTGSDMDSTLQYYDANAEVICERYETARLDDIHALLVNRLRPQACVLELGCGSGRDGAFLRDRGCEWWGVEGSFAMARQAVILHPELNGRIIRADFCQPLPFSEKRFDGLFSIASLMHLKAPNVVCTLGQSYLLLKDRAPLILSIPIIRVDVDDKGYAADGRFFLKWNESKWINAILEAGFSIDHCRNSTDCFGRDIIWLSVLARKRAEAQ